MMRRKSISCSVLGSLMLIAAGAFAAPSILGPGDITITSIYTDDPDIFSFVALEDIGSGTEIYFTDSGVKSDGSFRGNEGGLLWTASADVSAGTVIIWDSSSPSSEFAVANDSNVGNNGFNLSTSGDQVIAFQGSSASPTFIAAAQTNSNMWQADSTSTTTSALPPGLTVEYTAGAYGLGPGAGDEFDNRVYNVSYGTTGTKEELLILINYNTRWTGDNDIRPAIPSGFTVNAPPADTTEPVASISAVASPRNTPVGVVTISFDEDVQNVDISDFSLTRDISIIDISGLAVTQVNAAEYTIDLSTVTGTEGAYAFILAASNDVQDLAGNDLSNNPSQFFSMDTTAPVVDSFALDNLLQVGGDISGTYSTSNPGPGGLVSPSAIASTDLYVYTGSWSNEGALTGGTFDFTPGGSGVYGFKVVVTDEAGNSSSAIPTAPSDAAAFVVYNSTENAPLTRQVTADGTFDFPLENGLSVSLTFNGVSFSGTVTVSRTEGDHAPAGYNAAALIDQFISISSTDLLFTDYNLVIEYDEALLGGVDEADIVSYYRDNAGSITEGSATVDTVANTITITGLTGFSDWYAGDANASTVEWDLLD